MTGFRLSDQSSVRCAIEASYEVIAETFGDERSRRGFRHSGCGKVQCVMSQMEGMVIASIIVIVGAIGLASLSIRLAYRENEARRDAGPR